MTVGAVQPELASRMTREEELELGSRLLECRRDLLAVALADPASSAELDRVAAEVASGKRRIEAVVDLPAASNDERRRRFDQFRADVLRTRTAALQGRAPAAELPEHRALLDTLPLQWDCVERLLQRTWVGRAKANGVAGPRPTSPMPLELRRRVQALQADVERIVGRFVSSHQRLVSHVIQRYRNLGLSRDDLMQDGNIGLLRGVEKFDPRRGTPFASYAVWWIREAVGRALADQSRTIRLPVNALAIRYRLSRASRRLAHQLGRDPSARELARDTGLDPECIAEVLSMSRQPLSLDAPRGEDADTTLGNLLPDRGAVKPDERTASRERAQQISALLEGLTPRERQMIHLRFGLDGADERTLEEIGRSFDLTRERVRQIVATALDKLQRETRLRQLDL